MVNACSKFRLLDLQWPLSVAGVDLVFSTPMPITSTIEWVWQLDHRFMSNKTFWNSYSQNFRPAKIKHYMVRHPLGIATLVHSIQVWQDLPKLSERIFLHYHCRLTGRCCQYCRRLLHTWGHAPEVQCLRWRMLKDAVGSGCPHSSVLPSFLPSFPHTSISFIHLPILSSFLPPSQPP